VMRAVWIARPSLKVAAAAWIYAGGAHHTAFSHPLTMEHLVDFAEIAQVELVRIDEDTTLRDLRHELAWTDGIRPLRGR